MKICMQVPMLYMSTTPGTGDGAKFQTGISHASLDILTWKKRYTLLAWYLKSSPGIFSFNARFLMNLLILCVKFLRPRIPACCCRQVCFHHLRMRAYFSLFSCCYVSRERILLSHSLKRALKRALN